MLVIVIATQDHENYGAHDWDGRGECPQRWKAKGGADYHLPITVELASQGEKTLEKIIGVVARSLVENNDYYTTHVIGWSIEDTETYRPYLFDSYLEYGDTFPFHEIDLLGQTYHREIDHWPY